MFASLFSPLLGIIGSIATAYSNYKMAQLQMEEKKLDRAHELALFQARTDAMIKEAEANIMIAQETFRGQVDVAEANAFNTSLREGNQNALPPGVIEKMFERGPVMAACASVLTLLLGLCDVAKSSIRPGLTIYVTAIFTWAVWQTFAILRMSDAASLGHGDVWQTWVMILDFLFVILGTLWGWWFGDRRMAKFAVNMSRAAEK